MQQSAVLYCKISLQHRYRISGAIVSMAIRFNRYCKGVAMGIPRNGKNVVEQ